MQHTSQNELIVMLIISILSGLLSTMSIWVDKWDDSHLTLNDMYMIFLMTGWMFFFTGIYYQNLLYSILGAILVIGSFFVIRTQSLITPQQYIKGMIPHHSMAVFISKKLLQNQEEVSPRLRELADNIIKTQSQELEVLKSMS